MVVVMGMVVPMLMMTIMTVRVIMCMIVAVRMLPVGALLRIERRFHR